MLVFARELGSKVSDGCDSAMLSLLTHDIADVLQLGAL